MDLLMEIVEGPGTGRQIPVHGTVILGRDPGGADVVLEDGQVSRRHAKVEPSANGLVVEDLDSSNGTFVNHNEVHGPAELGPGDELLIGVTLLQVRSPEQVAVQASAVRPVPPALAREPAKPDYVDRRDDAEERQALATPSLDRLVDSRVKVQARLAPFALLILAALVVVIYLGTK
jgi:pSer/pThr/pTyr-binding forkhead associated (FHA) protein